MIRALILSSILLAGLGLNAQASATRIAPADAFKSTNGSFTNTLPAANGTILNDASTISSFSSGAGTVSTSDTYLQAINKLDGNQKNSATVIISGSAVDWSLCKGYGAGCLFTKTLGANTTFTFSNVAAGQNIILAITNTASNYTLSWPAAAKWVGGTAPTLTTGAHTDVFTCISYDGTNAYCNAVQNF